MKMYPPQLISISSPDHHAIFEAAVQPPSHETNVPARVS
jgi:hypothetical protein